MVAREWLVIEQPGQGQPQRGDTLLRVGLIRRPPVFGATIWAFASLVGAWSPCASAPLDRLAAESFAERAIGDVIDNGLVPGAVFALVQGDEVLVLRGFGVADIQSGKPMDPHRTLVRTGSMGKLFTAIAILQLIETGRLELDVDVNEYLTTLQVSPTYPESVTIRHLLSHTAGFTSEVTNTVFDEGSGGVIRTRPEQIKREFVRVRPPGLITAYDNFGIGLMGFVLGDVYGSDHGTVIRDRILTPLGMTNTVMGIPKARLADFTTCHDMLPSGAWVKCRYQVFRDVMEGAGNVSPTAADMTRFISAVLKGSEYDGGRLLAPETFAQFTNMDLNRFHPLVAGMGWIAQERGPIGRGGLGHNGGSRGTLSNLSIFPELNLGFFLSVNGSVSWPEDDMTITGLASYYLEGGESENYKALLDYVLTFHYRLLRELNIEDPGPSDANVQAAMRLQPFSQGQRRQLEGRYFPTYSVSHKSFVGRFLMPLIVPAKQVALASDGSLSIEGSGPYVQILPGLFENGNTGDRVAFAMRDGEVFMGRNAFPDIRRPWHANALYNTLPLVLCLLVLLTGGVYLRHADTRHRWIGWLALSGAIVFIAALVLEMEIAIRVIRIEGARATAALWRLPMQMALLTFLILSAMVIWRWRELVSDGRQEWIARTHLVLLGVSGLGLVVLAGYWGLVGLI